MDPISDMLTKIKNASLSGKPTVDFPYANLKYAIAKILEKDGFVKGVEKKKKKVGKNNKFRLSQVIEIELKYQDKIPAISGIKRVSKSGQRIYVAASKIKKVKGGYGIGIISTSKGGVISSKEAKKQKVGGELICEVW